MAQWIVGPPYARRDVPNPAGTGGDLKAWAVALAGWLATELATIQRSTVRASTRTVTASVAMTDNDGVILADATAAILTVTLLTPARARDMTVTIKKIDASGHAVTVGGTVDGVVNPTLATRYKSMTVWSDGSAWYKLAAV